MSMNIDNRIRVLFVDDEEGNLKAFKTTFRRDMDVVLATSGQEALNILEREPVHVIISDQRMPGMTGDTFLSIARERHPKAMRMLLTGYADLEAVVSAVNQGGIYAYATKPWDENDLRLRIQQAFEIQQLRESKEHLLNQYRQVFEVSGDPIVIVDHGGQLIDANPACAKLLGSDLGNLRGTSFTEYLEDPKALVRSLRSKREGTAFINVDLTLRTPAGNVIDCLMTATYLGRQREGRQLFQAVIKDVTDRKQEEKRLRQLNAQLDLRVNARTGQLLEALEDIGSFSYTVAHDLRSPLKNIAAMSEMLRTQLQDTSGDEEFAEFAERIHRSSERLLELVDDLLRFSQTNTRELEKRELDLHGLVESVVHDQVSEDRKQQITLDIDPDARILADAPMLKVVLHNLLSNSLKFTRTQEHPSITIGHRREGERDILFVRDNGVGFDARHKDKAFGVFKRLHGSDQFEGTGVGLAIVHRIVSKHGGEAWAESAVGAGATISIALPRQDTAKVFAPFIKVA